MSWTLNSSCLFVNQILYSARLTSHVSISPSFSVSLDLDDNCHFSQARLFLYAGLFVNWAFYMLSRSFLSTSTFHSAMLTSRRLKISQEATETVTFFQWEGGYLFLYHGVFISLRCNQQLLSCSFPSMEPYWPFLAQLPACQYVKFSLDWLKITVAISFGGVLSILMVTLHSR